MNSGWPELLTASLHLPALEEPPLTGKAQGHRKSPIALLHQPSPTFQGELEATAPWASDIRGSGGGIGSPAVKTQPHGHQSSVCWAQDATWHLLDVRGAGQELPAALPGQGAAGFVLQTYRGTAFLVLRPWLVVYISSLPLFTGPSLSLVIIGALAQLPTFSLYSAYRPN